MNLLDVALASEWSYLIDKLVCYTVSFSACVLVVWAALFLTAFCTKGFWQVSCKRVSLLAFYLVVLAA